MSSIYQLLKKKKTPKLTDLTLLTPKTYHNVKFSISENFKHLLTYDLTWELQYDCSGSSFVSIIQPQI